MLNRVEIRRLTRSLQNNPLLPSKTPGLLLHYGLGHCPLVLCSAVQSTLLHLTESGQTVSLYTSEFIRLLLSSVTLSLNTSNPVPLEAMHAHDLTAPCFTDDTVCFYHELLHAFSRLFFFPSFWYMLMLISAVQRKFL